jgi:hypothetical protein
MQRQPRAYVAGSRLKHGGRESTGRGVIGQRHRVHIFTRDKTGLVCLPTQLERSLQLY